MDKYQDNYHEKFDMFYKKKFTGNVFNPVEFIHHLENINFRFESGELSKLSDAAIDKIKSKFSFYQYGAKIAGLDIESKTYADDFRKLVVSYGAKYGYSTREG